MKIRLLFPFPVIMLMMIAISVTGQPKKAQHKQIVKPVKSTTSPFTISPSHHFTILWKQADSLSNLGQPKSALDIVDKIYAEARAGKMDAQLIKAVIYRIRLNADFQEDFLTTTISGLQKEISAASQPSQQILQSILAEVYRKYYQYNQYRFRNRTRVQSVISDSLETWDLATISSTITRTYLLSLENTDTLKRTPIGKFNDILTLEVFNDGRQDTMTKEAARFVPTLYDFLAGRALDYFTSGETTPILPAEHFEVDRQWFFAQPSLFAMNRMMIPADSAVPASFALRIFRDLALFHLKDQDPRALIETELKRFAFVHEKYTLPGKDSLYIDALRQFEQAEISSPWSSSVSYVLASFLNNQGQLYKPLMSGLHKWEIRSAMEVCDKAIQRFPGSEGSKNCKILAATIREPFLQVTTGAAVPADKPSLALAGVKNLKMIYFRLIKADPETYAERSGTLERKEFFNFLASLPAETSWSQNFPDDGDYQNHQAEIAIPGVPVGFWVLLGSTAKEFNDQDRVFVFAVTPFWSSQISYISKRNDDGSFDYFLLDRESGMPLKDATAETWEKSYNYRDRKYSNVKLQSYIADGQGRIWVPAAEDNRRGSSQFLKIFYKNDFLITDNFYQYPVYKGREQSFIQTMFYTDRAVYRPGQVIYFKGIVLERTGERSKIKTGHTTRVVFTDVNGQKISEQTLTTNSFGSINGSFTAPTGVLPGEMTISGESGSISVSVEEYKHPTFEVSCDPLEGNYKLGELLKVTGRAMAYAGSPVDAGTVKFRIVRTARFPFRDWGWFWPMPASPEVEIANGETTSDGEGKFTISFTAIPDLNVERTLSPVFDFLVQVDVTDINGETQSVTQTASVGYKSLLISASADDLLNLAEDSVVTIRTTNLNGRPTPTTVKVSLQRLRQPGRTLLARLWERPDRHTMTAGEFHARFPYDIFDDENNPATWDKEETVFEKTIHTASDSSVTLFHSASRIPHPGTYLLTLQASDPFGEIVEDKRYLTLFSPSSKEVPVNASSWFVPLKTSGEPGEKARFLIGSKEDDVNMIYEIRLRDSLVSREMIRISDRAMLLDIPIKEQYRGNFGINFVFVKHNRVFQHSQAVTVPHVNKKLGIAFGSFRSRLDPGEKEQWKITFSGANGKAASAEFMAAMYDASLDLFRPNEWTFNLYQRYSGMFPWDVDNSFRTSSGSGYSMSRAYENYRFHPGLRLNWFGSGYFSGHTRYSGASAGGRDKNMRVEMMDSPATTAEQSKGTVPSPEMKLELVSDSVKSSGNRKRQGMSGPETGLQIRRDFRETAFFYPVLETDSSGSLFLQFTAPESLSRWKFLGLAHTKSLDYGLIEKELVTRKELMVFPNAPRFVRQGDTVIFSTKIVSLSDRDLSGKVSLELSDGLTSQSLNGMICTTGDPASHFPDQEFTVHKGRSIAVSWMLVVPVSSSLSVLQYRVSAAAGAFSDGEEKAIPVLTNRMLVTESLPLPVRGKGTAGFSFDKLLKSGSQDQKETSLKNYRLTLEFASNPAWYAIQALPSLNDKQYDNADAIFSAFWSNSVAAFIANSNPKIKKVFEAWKELTPDALQSNLAKNQQLKTALLQETPWVMEANNETTRKQKLGLFFDLDNIGTNLRENLRKLQKLQKPDGGWTWFEGMPENRYITQNILTGLGKLYHLGITDIMNDPSSRMMVMNAIRYLDGEIQKDYENLKKFHSDNLDGNHLGSSQVQYLYARSFFMTDPASGIPDPGSRVFEAFNFYKRQAEKFWLQHDRSLQGMIALALNRLGSKEVPALILKSLSEKAIHSDELGMYWAGELGYLWYQAPIETQALMIEAFDEIGRDETTVEDLKIWLLKQKQVQDWRSTRATLEACYALLLRGTDLLSDDPGVKITLGKEKINSDKLIDVKTEAGTGYFQLSWAGNEISPEMGKITVSKSGHGVAWGAVYWQYFEDLDKISPAVTPLKLEKKLFVEKNTSSGPVLEAITNSEERSTNDTSKSGLPVHLIAHLLKPGDKLKVRIVLTVDRDLEFVHMKDMRASAFEPLNLAFNSLAGHGGGFGEGLSGYRYQDGLSYYQSTTDQATNFFFDYLPKGTFVFEYALRVNAGGEYSNGITTIQCMYAPEFSAHSGGIRVGVK